MPLFGQKTGVSCPHERNKIGDSVLWIIASQKTNASQENQRIPRKPTHPKKTNTSQENQHIPEKPTHPRKINTSHVPTIFCSHLAKLLQKIIAEHGIPILMPLPYWSENGVSCPHERNKIGDSVLWIIASRKTSTSHVAIIFCNHLAKLLQTSQKNQHIQPSATHPTFGTILLRTWTTLSSFDEISRDLGNILIS